MSDQTNQTEQRGRGRPRVYATAADRQRAYRARLRERGMVVRQRVMRDASYRVGGKIVSDVLMVSTDVGAALAARDR